MDLDPDPDPAIFVTDLPGWVLAAGLAWNPAGCQHNKVEKAWVHDHGLIYYKDTNTRLYWY